MGRIQRVVIILLVLALAGVAYAATHDIVLQPTESVSITCAGLSAPVVVGDNGIVTVYCRTNINNIPRPPVYLPVVAGD